MPIVMTQRKGNLKQETHRGTDARMIMAARVGAASARTQHLCSTCRVPAVVALVSVLSSRPPCVGRITQGSPAVPRRSTPQHAYGQHAVCTQRILRVQRCIIFALGGIGAGTLPQCCELHTPAVPVYAAAWTTGKGSQHADARGNAGLYVRLRPRLLTAVCRGPLRSSGPPLAGCS